MPNSSIINMYALRDTVTNIQSELNKYIIKTEAELKAELSEEDLAELENGSDLAGVEIFLDSTRFQKILRNTNKSLEDIKSIDEVYKIDFIKRHNSVVKLLLLAWLICISTWLYQLKDLFNIKLDLKNSPD